MRGPFELPARHRYAERPDADLRATQAELTLRAVLALSICDVHKRELLSVCLWKVTEARAQSKYRLRYRTPASLKARARLQHEHVYRRQHLVSQLMAGEAVDAVLLRAVACTVTVEEHRQLTPHNDVDGWERYRRAGLRVIDTVQAIEVDLCTLP